MFLSLSPWAWVIVATWTLSVTWVILFFSYAVKHAPVIESKYDGPLAEVIPFPRCGVRLDDPPEFGVFVDGHDKGWGA